MINCVSDGTVVINIQGIRYVTWGENAYASPHHLGKYHLTVTYKGNNQSFYYRTEEEARSIFNKVREAMDKGYRDEKLRPDPQAGQYSDNRPDS